MAENLCVDFTLFPKIESRLTRLSSWGYLIFTLFTSRAHQKSAAARNFSSELPPFQPNLSWAPYRLWMRIRQPEARAFYEKNIRWRLQEKEQTDD